MRVIEVPWKEKMLEKLKKEKDIEKSSLRLAKTARKGRFEELKKRA